MMHNFFRGIFGIGVGASIVEANNYIGAKFNKKNLWDNKDLARTQYNMRATWCDKMGPDYDTPQCIREVVQNNSNLEVTFDNYFSDPPKIDIVNVKTGNTYKIWSIYRNPYTFKVVTKNNEEDYDFYTYGAMKLFFIMEDLRSNL